MRRTTTVLDYLQSLNVSVTFFVVGLMIGYRPNVLQREFTDGHVIASHSYTHPDLTTFTMSQVRKEIIENEEIIASTVCYRPKIFRPPFGVLTSAQQLLLNVRTLPRRVERATPRIPPPSPCTVAPSQFPCRGRAQSMGYSIVNWNLDTQDWLIGTDNGLYLSSLSSQQARYPNSAVISLQVGPRCPSTPSPPLCAHM